MSKGQEELKPCPFCGGEAMRVTLDDDANFDGDVIVCTKCDACSRVVFGEKEGLVDAWNRRQQAPAAITSAEQLTALLENVRGLHDICAEFIAEDVFGQLGQPVPAQDEQCGCIASILGGGHEADCETAQAAPQGDDEYMPEGIVDAVMRDRETDCVGMAASALKAISAPPPERSQWVSVNDQMPESRRTVLAYYTNRLGNGRRIRAQYIKAWTVPADDDADPDTECVEYSEQDDTYYLLEGWYECIDNWDEYMSIAVNEGPVTHWMPLPAAPACNGEQTQ